MIVETSQAALWPMAIGGVQWARLIVRLPPPPPLLLLSMRWEKCFPWGSQVIRCIMLCVANVVLHTHHAVSDICDGPCCSRAHILRARHSLGGLTSRLVGLMATGNLRMRSAFCEIWCCDSTAPITTKQPTNSKKKKKNEHNNTTILYDVVAGAITTAAAVHCCLEDSEGRKETIKADTNMFYIYLKMKQKEEYILLSFPYLTLSLSMLLLWISSLSDLGFVDSDTKKGTIGLRAIWPLFVVNGRHADFSVFLFFPYIFLFYFFFLFFFCRQLRHCVCVCVCEPRHQARGYTLTTMTLRMCAVQCQLVIVA